LELSPLLYHKVIRPNWITKMYIHNKINQHINLVDKRVLDFGAGTGANCLLSKPSYYIGIDPDVKRINFAKKLYPDYFFSVLQGDKLPLEDHSIDIVLIVAVLHHIPPDKVKIYMKEFKRVLSKQGGQIVIIEPCFFKNTHISNWFMKNNDNGAFIQTEDGYLDYFKEEGFTCNVLNKYRKCFLYNEFFFLASSP
jgi:ubiquinone/menaquinone biosynthesis C-methylase UbiE